MTRHLMTARVAFAALFVAIASGAAAQEYQVKFGRAAKVGDGYTLSATGELTGTNAQKVEDGGDSTGTVSMKVRLDGACKVLAVDKAGRPTKLTCTVEQFVFNGKAAAERGTVITSEVAAGKLILTVNGKAVDGPLASPISFVLFPRGGFEGPDRDDVDFGTDKPQKAGASWPVNAAAVAAAMSARGATVKKEDVKGSSKLVEVTKVDGRDALRIESDLAVEYAAPTREGKGTETRKVVARRFALLPADPAGGVIEESSTMETTTAGKGTMPPRDNPFTSRSHDVFTTSAKYGDRTTAP